MLKVHDGPLPGPIRDREDFPQAARVRAALQRQKRWVDLFIPKNERERQKLSLKNYDQILNGLVGIETTTNHRRHLHLQQRGGSQENGTNHNKENGKINNSGKSGEYSLSLIRQFFFARILHIRCFL